MEWHADVLGRRMQGVVRAQCDAERSGFFEGGRGPVHDLAVRGREGEIQGMPALEAGIRKPEGLRFRRAGREPPARLE